MSLRRIFEELYADAAARETHEQRGEALKQLRRGATIAVRRHARRRQVILGRAGVPVGEEEIVVFQRDGAIPPAAERQDYQAGRWHYVAFTWEEAPGLFDLPAAPGSELPNPGELEPYRLPEIADLPEQL